MTCDLYLYLKVGNTQGRLRYVAAAVRVQVQIEGVGVGVGTSRPKKPPHSLIFFVAIHLPAFRVPRELRIHSEEIDEVPEKGGHRKDVGLQHNIGLAVVAARLI